MLGVCASLGGGLVGGDQIRMNVRGRRRARALLMTQASTKYIGSLRPAKHATPARGRRRAARRRSRSSRVFYAADFSQTQRYELREDASLVVGLDDVGTSRVRRALGILALRESYRRARNQRPVSGMPSSSSAIWMRSPNAGSLEVLLTAVLRVHSFRGGGDDCQPRRADAVARRQDLIVSDRPCGGGALLRRPA